MNKMLKEKSSILTVDERTLKMISVLISDYPELGYKTTKQFIDEAIFDLLSRKALEIGNLQKWMKVDTPRNKK